MALSEPVRRLPHLDVPKNFADEPHRAPPPLSDRPPRSRRKFLLPWKLILYACGAFCFMAFISLVLWQSRIVTPEMQSSSGFAGGGGGLGRRRRDAGGAVRFHPSDLVQRFRERGGLDRLRSQPRVGVRSPRLALVMGSMNRDPISLMLLSMVKSLQQLGYMFSVFSLEDGEAHSLWRQVCCRVPILGPKDFSSVDWSKYDGVILSSLEAKKVISSLMQDPFCFIPLVWLVHDDILGKRLPVYASSGHKDLISDWQNAFKRADVVVFPEFSLPMLYAPLDTGNFYVIPGSPLDIWAARSYSLSHSRQQLRHLNGYNEVDLIILVLGNYFFYDEKPWDFPAAFIAFAPQIENVVRTEGLQGKLKFAFLYGNSTDAYESAFKAIITQMGFPDGSVRQYGIDADVNSVLLMADIVLYLSFQEEQFPPLLVRAMAFGVPIIAPESATIKKNVVDKHAFLFQYNDSDTLVRAFSDVISDGKLSELAQTVAAYGKLFSKNMLASKCLVDYAYLLENILQFPADSLLPSSTNAIQHNKWLWNLFGNNIGRTVSHAPVEKSSIVYLLEESFDKLHTKSISGDSSETSMPDHITQIDWDDLGEMEISEDLVRRELQELEERTEKKLSSWEEVYRNARKAEKQKSDAHERDEGELERSGQSLCIYEVYSGVGSWPFLHHGSLYRGISLSRAARRPRTDDVDAVSHLPILNNSYYRNLLCELGAMFSIANKVDNIHKIPWIGFQSWRTTGRNVSLSINAENALEEAIREGIIGDVIYFWAEMGMDIRNKQRGLNLDFWSFCDIFNGGHCRSVFKEAFSHMYGLPNDTAALPPMPADGDHWSSFHSWVMPTPSFMEFVMFSRIFTDSLHSVSQNKGVPDSCVLGSSELEKRQCYCRVLEVLVNVWAYHSARKMVYVNPHTGELLEQHPIQRRRGLMWAKYFDFRLLKSMDEDLAEETDDGLLDMSRRLWPLTGEVYWQGMLDREREERYRRKMDKKRKNKEKMLERQKHGYKQKALGTKP